MAARGPAATPTVLLAAPAAGPAASGAAPVPTPHGRNGRRGSCQGAGRGWRQRPAAASPTSAPCLQRPARRAPTPPRRRACGWPSPTTPPAARAPQTPHGWVLMAESDGLVTFGQRQGAVGIGATVVLKQQNGRLRLQRERRLRTGRLRRRAAGHQPRHLRRQGVGAADQLHGRRLRHTRSRGPRHGDEPCGLCARRRLPEAAASRGFLRCRRPARHRVCAAGEPAGEPRRHRRRL